MTDEEIKKALECCAVNDCDECPLFDFPKLIADCMPELLKNAFYLINGQQAEIERLNEKITTKDESNYYFMGQLRTAREELQTAKYEAVKEFAERLKEKSWIGMWETVAHVVVDEIDNLVKEMTEVSRNERIHNTEL